MEKNECKAEKNNRVLGLLLVFCAAASTFLDANSHVGTCDEVGKEGLSHVLDEFGARQLHVRHVSLRDLQNHQSESHSNAGTCAP